MKKISKKIKTPEKNENVGGFKIKLTNLKKSYYPDKLEKTDLFGIKIGDHLTKVGNTIYEVTDIQREVVDEQRINLWWGKVSPSVRRVREKELIAEYRKNSNFGSCCVTLKPIIRGSNVIAKGRIIKFNELDFLISYNKLFYIIKLEDVIKSKSHKISNLVVKAQTLNKKLKDQIAMRDAINHYINNKTVLPASPGLLEIKNEKGLIISTLDPLKLI